MTITTIFYSYSGVTRGVAKKIQSECGGELVEVKALKPYSKLTTYTVGCYRAAKGEADGKEVHLPRLERTINTPSCTAE